MQQRPSEQLFCIATCYAEYVQTCFVGIMFSTLSWKMYKFVQQFLGSIVTKVRVCPDV